MAVPSQKVQLYSLNDLKTATDDALPPYLTTLPPPYRLEQSHSLTNTRLVLGYSAVLIAGALFAADYKLGWDATKAWTGPACALYFLINGALTLWVWKVEGGTVFVGTRPGGQKLTLSSSVQKHKPTYNLHIQYSAPSGKKWEDKTISAPFHRWFSSDGYLQQPQLKEWLSSNIEPLGLAEQKRVKDGEKSNSSGSTPIISSSTTSYEALKPGQGQEATTLSDISDVGSGSGSVKTPKSRKGGKKKA